MGHLGGPNTLTERLAFTESYNVFLNILSVAMIDNLLSLLPDGMQGRER